MKYYTIQPSAQLKPFVRCFWVLEHTLGADEPSYIYRSIADGCTEMVFHYQTYFQEINASEGLDWSTSGIQFQTTRYRRFIAKQSFGIFGAYIYPFAVPYFFNIPASDGSNHALDYDTFLGSAGRELEEKIMLATDNQQRAQILSAFLEKRLNRPLKNDNVVAAIKHVIHSGKCETVSYLADRFNLSVRQFDRRFKEYAGFGPKKYLRLTRLHNAIQQYGTQKSLTQIALECGYYDQSHFIHDVKAFTGYHPGFYFSGDAEGTEYRNI
ncbi:helix-turn-helix domain-containing protein [soil metagenome]|jgi:AraC-like DNA-binding protein